MLSRYVAGEWDVEIPVIISNHPDLAMAGQQFGIPFEVVPVTRDNKDEMEQREFDILDKYEVDFIVLARYMQILSENFINRYPNRIINIHHSFLPAFVGAKPYHQAYERGVKIDRSHEPLCDDRAGCGSDYRAGGGAYFAQRHYPGFGEERSRP